MLVRRSGLGMIWLSRSSKPVALERFERSRGSQGALYHSQGLDDHGAGGGEPVCYTHEGEASAAAFLWGA